MIMNKTTGKMLPEVMDSDETAGCKRGLRNRLKKSPADPNEKSVVDFIFNHDILILILHCSSLESEVQLALPRHSHSWNSSRISVMTPS
jgi:hypothetical protein